MRSQLGELVFLSRLEIGRIRNPKADPLALTPFEDLQEEIAHSFQTPNLFSSAVPRDGIPPNVRQWSNRPFQDENLLKKLVQFRDQIPLSHRIIRVPRS